MGPSKRVHEGKEIYNPALLHGIMAQARTTYNAAPGTSTATFQLVSRCRSLAVGYLSTAHKAIRSRAGLAGPLCFPQQFLGQEKKTWV